MAEPKITSVSIPEAYLRTGERLMEAQAYRYVRVVRILADSLAIDAETVKHTDTLATLGADSLDLIDIASRLEQEFDIDLDDASMDATATVSDVVSLIRDKQAKVANVGPRLG